MCLCPNPILWRLPRFACSMPRSSLPMRPVDIPGRSWRFTPSPLMTERKPSLLQPLRRKVQQTAVRRWPPLRRRLRLPTLSLPPVVTPTPMRILAGYDAITVDVLTHGLWKPLGTDGECLLSVFTADGKLLTVTVTDYTVTDGVAPPARLNGTLDIGSDSAFTLHGENGELSGYVLNRQGESVAPEEFVTPTPTPVPAHAESGPRPLHPRQHHRRHQPHAYPCRLTSRRVQQAPNLANLSDAAFEKAQTLPVYCAPGEKRNLSRGRRAGRHGRNCAHLRRGKRMGASRLHHWQRFAGGSAISRIPRWLMRKTWRSWAARSPLTQATARARTIRSTAGGSR